MSDWYESEQPVRIGMIAEVQRIRRRTAVRPIPVIVFTLLVTAAVTYKVATKPRQYTADIVLAVDEGIVASSTQSGIPFDQLKEYTASVLLPDVELLRLIEQRYPGRIAKVGGPFALEAFRGKIVVAIWKNSFVYYHEVDANAQKSARIGIEVTDEDPEVALEIGRDLAAIVIRTHEENQTKLAKNLSEEVALMRDTMIKRIDDLAYEILMKQTALAIARKGANNQVAAMMFVELAELSAEQKRAEDQLAKIAASPEAVADRLTAAQLDTTISVVDAVAPPRHEQSWLASAMIITVIGVGSLLGSALVLGAFDSRVHETEDVARLGLPVLGHVPGFAGDQVGSLEARGAARARVPSFLRWR